ncbi:MAG: aspartate-semialdehyde dehydrogenase [Phycisphaerales bacterium]
MPLPPLPNILVIGATGVTGAELLRCLESRGLAHGMLRLAGSPTRPGEAPRPTRTVSYCGTDVPVEPMEARCLDDIDIVFLCAGGDISRQWAPVAKAQGAIVIDFSSAFRLDPAVALVVPEINAESLPHPAALAESGAGTIIANPNCSTIIALMAVAPIDRLTRVRRMTACTYQAASGGGRAMMEMLEEQARAWARDGDDASAPGRPYHFNLFSHDTPIGPHGANEEERKFVNESRRILGRDDLAVCITCIRVPVLRAHSIALHLELTDPVRPSEVRAALADAPGVAVVDDPEAGRFPEPRDASGGDDVLAGRIRGEPDAALAPGLTTTTNGDAPTRYIALFVSGDQLRKGASLNAVQIVEQMLVQAGFTAPAGHMA